MALVKCKECGAEISSKAEACPRCGAKVRRTSGCAWLVLILFGLLIVPRMFSGFSEGFNGARRRAQSLSNQQSTPTATPSTATTASATPTPAPRESAQPAQRGDAAEIIVAAKKVVRMRLKDPESAQFKDIQTGDSVKTGPAAFGRVNSKNALGAYTGYQRFVSNGTTVLLEEENEEGTLAAWRSLLAKETTVWSSTALADPSIPVAVDVKALIGKNQSEVAKILGSPTGKVKDKNGPGFEYRGGDVEIIFINGKADWLTVNGLKDVPFAPAALAAVGLAATMPPTFGNEFVIRWEPYGTYPYVGIAPGTPGKADWIYVKAFTK